MGSLPDAAFQTAQGNAAVHCLITLIVHGKGKAAILVYHAVKYTPGSFPFCHTQAPDEGKGQFRMNLRIHLIHILPALAAGTGKGQPGMLKD